MRVQLRPHQLMQPLSWVRVILEDERRHALRLQGIVQPAGKRLVGSAVADAGSSKQAQDSPRSERVSTLDIVFHEDVGMPVFRRNSLRRGSAIESTLAPKSTEDAA